MAHRSVSKLRVEVTMPAVSYQVWPLQAHAASASMAQYGATMRPVAAAHMPMYPPNCSRTPIQIVSTGPSLQA